MELEIAGLTHFWDDLHDKIACETWAAARFLEMSDGKGPRPLRSAEQPWRKDSLTAAEADQVAVGNALLRAYYMIMYLSWL